MHEQNQPAELPCRIPGATFRAAERGEEPPARHLGRAVVANGQSWANDDDAIVRLRDGLRRWQPAQPETSTSIH